MTGAGSLLIAFLACLGEGGTETARLGEPFRLRVDETLSVEGTEFSIALTFTSVLRDSRCPEGVECIRAGEAVVVFAVRVDDDSIELRFEVPPEGSAEAPLAEYPLRVSLDGLEPQARDGRKIEPDAYVATVTVSASER